MISGQNLQFRFAKTMPELPHSYVRRSPENEAEYLRLLHRIGEEGVWEMFQGRRWYARDGFKYWSLGSHVINRAEVLTRRLAGARVDYLPGPACGLTARQQHLKNSLP